MSSKPVVPPSHLLLLPPAPWPVSIDVLNAAYAPAILSTLSKLRSESSKATLGSTLDITLPLPYLYEHQDKARSALYPAVQKGVAALYKLICVIAARQNINVEDAEGIDVRVTLLSYPRNGDEEMTEKNKSNMFGPVINLTTLKASKRPWKSVFSIGSEQGERLLQQFLAAQNYLFEINRVPGGIVQINDESSNAIDSGEKAIFHDSVAVGRTWDHIHIGHKLLLTMTAFMLDTNGNGKKNQSKSLTIGITGDELLKNKKYAEMLQDWDERQNSVVHFLRAIMDFRPARDAHVEVKQVNEPGPNGHAVHTKIAGDVVLKGVEINDPFGPTITDKAISALVVSGETRAGGKAVNDKRIEKGWPQLEVFEVDVLDAQEALGSANEQENAGNSFESKLSSTSIRKAIRDRGKLRSKA